jgi:predicted tellurium resistance membrane protein TerC
MHLIANFARIIIIDLALSGDNALLIGMAAHRLSS